MKEYADLPTDRDARAGFLYEASALRVVEYQYIRRHGKIGKAPRLFLDTIREQMGELCAIHDNLLCDTPERKYQQALIEEYLLCPSLPIFSREVGELDLPLLTQQGLTEQKIVTLRELVAKTEQELLQKNKIARHSVRDIETTLATINHHLQLGMRFYCD